MSDALTFELVTPEKLAYSAKVSMVEVPGELGDFGVLVGHAPFISIIRPGVVTVHQVDGSQERLFISGGYAEVNPQGCTVLAERLIDLAAANKLEVQQSVEQARKQLESAKDEREQAKAEKQLRIQEALFEAVK